jgi:hypothetical protein
MLWLLWMCGADRRKLVKAAALCAETAIPYADEKTADVCLYAVQTCIAWSEGDATDEDLDVARWEAWLAWRDASWAAARAAEAAAEAAWAAARAAEAATEAATEAAAAHRQHANIVRGVFPTPPRL